MKREFLLEIGCEEIPARMIPEAEASLRELLEGELKAAGVLGREGFETYSTPRRLVAYCPNLLPAEPDRVSEQLGPPHRVALDPAGKPTQAARSFAAKMGVPVEKLKVVKTPKGAYMAAVKQTPGRLTPRLLAEVLPRVIPAIRFPRSMYWGSRRDVRFIRPIRWLLALYAGRVVDFALGGVRSGSATHGHRVLGSKRIAASSFADYSRKLRKAWVLISRAERAERIRSEQARLVAGKRLRLPSDGKGASGYEELLALVVNSTEYPSVLLGSFEPAFAELLPEEVLTTVMVHHQKYFYLRDAQGKLAPYFLAVIDNETRGGERIRRNHERVLQARFRDAEFFWNADKQTRLEDRLPLLAGVTFAEGLGSYCEKTERVQKLAAWMAQRASAPGRRADIHVVERAARLAKCDLTTQLVGELPELQGIAGGLLARAQGEDERVALAIYDHHKPRGAGDDSPRTFEGAVVALADKADTLVACFAAGLLPSGSSDPFGLRRAGQGIVKIILDHGFRLNANELLGEAVAILEAQAPSPKVRAAGADLPERAGEFLLERARYLLAEFAYDELNAVFAADASDFVDARARLQALRQIRSGPHFEPLSAAFKRIRNILEQAGNGRQRSSHPIDPALLEAGAERDLYEAFEKLRPQVAALRSRQDYLEALRLIASLRPQVDRFFDDVLVMTDDARVRENRLALLARLLQEFSTIADFAEIVPRQPARAGAKAGGR